MRILQYKRHFPLTDTVFPETIMSFAVTTIILIAITAQAVSCFFRSPFNSLSKILLANQIEAILAKLEIEVVPLSDIPAEVATPIREAIVAGKRADAIKTLRQHTRLGLRQAKDEIDDVATYWARNSLKTCSLRLLHKQADLIISRLGILFEPFPEVSESVRQEIQALEKNHARVDAIKLYQIFTGVELREAKDAIDDHSTLQDPHSSFTGSLPLLHKKVDQILSHLALHADPFLTASASFTQSEKELG